MSDDLATFLATGLPALLSVVVIGSISLVIPTGAAVSAAGAVAWRQVGPFGVLGVLVAGATGAYLGDLVVYAGCRLGGEKLASRLRWQRGGRVSSSVTRITDRLLRRDVQTLVIGRLLPAGRMPVLLAAGLGGYSWRRFAWTDLPAVTVWALTYTVIGVAGGSLFPETWESVLAAVALVLVLSALARRISPPGAGPPDDADADGLSPGPREGDVEPGLPRG